MIVPSPTYNEPELTPQQEADARHYAKVIRIINMPTWKCHCGAVMMGCVLYCIYCKNWRSQHTPRPSTYLDPSNP